MEKQNKQAQAIARHMLSQEGVSSVWGHVYEGGGVGWARVSFVVKSNMLNAHGTIHGGLIFSLADTAFAYACNSRNVRTVSQYASITFLNPATVNENLTAEAREESVQGRSGVYIVTVTGEGGRVVAIFHGVSRTLRGCLIEEET